MGPPLRSYIPRMAEPIPLSKYKAKRNFAVTPEPAEGGQSAAAGLQFVVQKHWATRLHYDFRLELDGVMLSWAVPKGPSYDTADKRMAVHVEDHPISYNAFEGTIPPKQYGAGKVVIWDKGVWVPVGNPREGYKDGNLKFELRGHKLRGKWALVRIKSRDEKQNAWLLIKERDQFVRPASEFSVVDEMPDSVAGLPPPPARPSRPNRPAFWKAPRRPPSPPRWRPSSPPWSTDRRARATTGSWRSSSTGTECWRAWMTLASDSSRATATTGRRSCRTWRATWPP